MQCLLYRLGMATSADPEVLPWAVAVVVGLIGCCIVAGIKAGVPVGAGIGVGIT